MSPSSGASARRFKLAWPRQIAAFGIIVAICLVATTAMAQRRGARGGRGAAPAGGAAGYDNRYGSGYGGTGNSAGSRANGDAGSRGDSQGPLKYPARTNDAAGGALAEYQKPTYDHQYFAISSDGTRMALSGRHMEKETSTKGDAPAKVKRDGSGKPIVIGNVLEVVDVASGRSVVAFKPPVLFENLALSPNNQFLAAETSQQAGVVNVLHLASRKSKQLKTGLRRIPPGGLVFSSDSRSINIILPDRLLTVPIGSGETKEFKYDIASPAVSFSPLTNMVAVGVSRSRHGGPEIGIYDVTQGKTLENLEVPSGPSRVEFSADGKYLAATIAGGVVRLWQTSDWTSVGSVAGQFAFDPGQLAVSPDGQLVAVRQRGAGSQEMKVINITGGDTVQSIRTREMFFLPTGLLAVADVTGPFYLNTTSGDVTELPGGDAALAQAGAAQSQFGDGSMAGNASSPPTQVGYGQATPGQPSPQVGYGQVGAGQNTALPPEYASRYSQSPQQPQNGQPGYGGVAPQQNGQPGYGGVGSAQVGSAQAGSAQDASLPPEYASRYSQSPQQPQNAQPGYGGVAPQQTIDHSGYGQTSTSQPAVDHSGYGQTSTSQPSIDHSGYGQTSTSQPSNSHPGYGQTSTSQPGYGQASPQSPNGQTDSPSPVGKPFLDQKQQVGPRLEWNREITSRRGGTFSFRVAAPGPFAVTVVSDRAYRAVTGRDRKQFNKEDVLLTADAKGPTFDGKVTVPAGSSWFIVENKTDGPVEFQLQCFALQPTSSSSDATSNGAEERTAGEPASRPPAGQSKDG